MSGIDFSKKVWSVTFYHNATPDGIWSRVVNAEDEKPALLECMTLFQQEGLNTVRIYNAESFELIPMQEAPISQEFLDYLKGGVTNGDSE